MLCRDRIHADACHLQLHALVVPVGAVDIKCPAGVIFVISVCRNDNLPAIRVDTGQRDLVMGFLRRRQTRIPGKGIEALLIRGHASIRVRVHQLRLRKPGEKYAGPPPVFFKILIVQHAAVCVPPGFYPFVSFSLHIGQLTHIHGSVIVRGVRAVLIIAVGVDRSQTGFHVPDTHPDVCRLSNILRKVREGGGCFALGYRQDIRLRQYGSFYLCSVRFCPGSC